MRNYSAFLKKELLESVRTYKLLILGVIFALFGIMSPLAAKLMPELLSSFLPEGMEITLLDPAAIDSWAQFFKNVSQMGLIVLVIVFSGILSGELSKGTLINVLTKGLSRNAVILAKFTAMVLLWTVSYLTAFLFNWGYTVYLFPDGGISNLFFSVFCLWLFGFFLLAVLLFAATLIKSHYGSLLVTGGVIVILLLLNIVPSIKEYNPISLAANNVTLLVNGVEASSLYLAGAITGLCSLLLLVCSLLVFRKKQI